MSELPAGGVGNPDVFLQQGKAHHRRHRGCECNIVASDARGCVLINNGLSEKAGVAGKGNLTTM